MEVMNNSRLWKPDAPESITQVLPSLARFALAYSQMNRVSSSPVVMAYSKRLA